MQRRLCVWLLSLMVGALAGWATWTNAVLLWPASSVSAAALLGKLRAEPRFARLDLVVEFPFGPSGGPHVTLSGCLDSPTDARAARRALYAEGVALVFDSTQVTPRDDLTPGYVDSVCRRTDWMRDGRSVFKFMAMPMHPQGDLAHIPFTDSDHKGRVRASLDMGEDLQALGVNHLAWALQEIYADLTLWKRGVYDPEALIRHVQMKLEIWARLPPQDVQGESLAPAEWKRRQREAAERFQKTIQKERGEP